MAKRKIPIVENLIRGRYGLLKHICKLSRRMETAQFDIIDKKGNESKGVFDPANRDHRAEMKGMVNLLREMFQVARSMAETIEHERDRAAAGDGDPELGEQAVELDDDAALMADEVERRLMELDETTQH